MKRLKEMEERERKTQELLHSSQNLDGRRKSAGMNAKPRDKQLLARDEALEKVQRYTLAFEQIHQATGRERVKLRILDVLDVRD